MFSTCFLRVHPRRYCHVFDFMVILVPRAYDPSGLRQESRALGATISGMRHRCRLRDTGWAEFGYFFFISKWLLPELSIPAAGQKDRRLWGRECFMVTEIQISAHAH